MKKIASLLLAFICSGVSYSVSVVRAAEHPTLTVEWRISESDYSKTTEKRAFVLIADSINKAYKISKVTQVGSVNRLVITYPKQLAQACGTVAYEAAGCYSPDDPSEIIADVRGFYDSSIKNDITHETLHSLGYNNDEPAAGVGWTYAQGGGLEEMMTDYFAEEANPNLHDKQHAGYYFLRPYVTSIKTQLSAAGVDNPDELLIDAQYHQGYGVLNDVFKPYGIDNFVTSFAPLLDTEPEGMNNADIQKFFRIVHDQIAFYNMYGTNDPTHPVPDFQNTYIHFLENIVKKEKLHSSSVRPAPQGTFPKAVAVKQLEANASAPGNPNYQVINKIPGKGTAVAADPAAKAKISNPPQDDGTCKLVLITLSKKQVDNQAIKNCDNDIGFYVYMKALLDQLIPYVMLIALLMIIASGLQYMLSGVAGDTKAARARIVGVLGGVIFYFIIELILNLVTPGLKLEPSAANTVVPPGIHANSSSIKDGQVLPKEYTCEGGGSIPPLSLGAISSKTKDAAVVVTDPDAPGGTFVHWTAWGLPLTSTTVQGGTSGRNGFGSNGYGAPCPPAGSTHHYVFITYQLDNKVALPAGSSLSQLQSSIAGHVVSETHITTTYASGS